MCIKVQASNMCIFVMWSDDSTKGIAEASHLKDDVWMINRVLVEPSNLRGQGIGSKMLQELIRQARVFGAKLIKVTPGGYNGAKERQFKFYINNGFIQVNQKGLFHLKI